MKTIERIAYFQNVQNDNPNVELAKELASTGDKEAIKEIAEGLYHKNKRVQSNCLKVLYEIAYREPVLVTKYSNDFLSLLDSKNNRMVWGSMIALDAMGEINPLPILLNIEKIMTAIDKGSVITKLRGLSAMAKALYVDKTYNQKYFKYLLNHAMTCRPSEVAPILESIFPTIDTRENSDAFSWVMDKRLESLSPRYKARVMKFKRKNYVLL